MPTTVSYSTSPCRQISWNTPASTHSWKRRCADDEEQIPVAFNAFYCIPLRSTGKIASIASRSGTAAGDNQADAEAQTGTTGRPAHNQSGIRQPLSTLAKPIPSPLLG
jgi:hypothetical protein